MTDAHTPGTGPEGAPDTGVPQDDPTTGAPAATGPGGAAEPDATTTSAADATAGDATDGDLTDGDAINTEAVNDDVTPPAAADGASESDAAASAAAPQADSGGDHATYESEHPDTALARERLEDLQRLQAEYVNYKRRVDRDRAVTQERVVWDVLETVLPVLDDIHAAREHGDLVDGPFAAIAEKLETTLGKYGLERFGAKGEAFDPMHHEALMHAPWPEGDDAMPADAQGTTIVTVLQPGYRAGEHVIRPARVAVADPE